MIFQRSKHVKAEKKLEKNRAFAEIMTKRDTRKIIKLRKRKLKNSKRIKRAQIGGSAKI